MKQYLRAEIQEMANSEILKMVDTGRLAVIKETDPHPEIRVYGIGHEGSITTPIVGEDETTIQWAKNAVINLYSKITNGLAVFNRHATTNEHAGRKKIGEVIGKTVQTINGITHALAAIYIKPDFRKTPLDFASIEASIAYLQDGADAWIDDIKQVTGIALGNSEVDSPGFPGATLLGAVQAFAANTNTKGEIKMELADVKKAVVEGRFKPSDIFAVTELLGDTIVADYVKTEKHDVYQQSVRLKGELDQVKIVADKEKADLVKENATLKAAQVTNKSTQVLTDLAKERKMTDQQKAFVDRNISQFKTEAKDDANLKSELNTFIDGQLKAFDEVAKLLGVEPAKEKEGDITPGGANQIDDEQVDEYLDPEKNPAIPKQVP